MGFGPGIHTAITQIANVEAIRDFRSTWKDAPLARSKKQDRTVGFFYFCHRSGYIASQPITTKVLGKIKVDQKPTDYLTPAEFNKLIDATPDAAEEIRNVPAGKEVDPRYFFWSGNGLPKSAVADFQRSFRRLVKLANLEKPALIAILPDPFALEAGQRHGHSISEAHHPPQDSTDRNHSLSPTRISDLILSISKEVHSSASRSQAGNSSAM